MFLARRSPNSLSHYRTIFAFHTESWTSWPVPFFKAILQMFHSSADRILNAPNYGYLRAVDAKMYVLLGMRTFNRGPPMIPDPAEASVHIEAGRHLGLVSWSRFQPQRKFHLCEYLQCFMEKLGHKLEAYEVMDGRKLVPYQCVVLRHQWDEVRSCFLEAFRV